MNKADNNQNPNSNQKQELIFDDVESILASNFDANLPTKVLVHGFGDSGTTSWVIGVKNEFLKQGIFKYLPDYTIFEQEIKLVKGQFTQDEVSFFDIFYLCHFYEFYKISRRLWYFY